MGNSILKVSDLTKRFGALTAVEGVTLDFENELCALIGPNGAGKTTFLNLVSGNLPPTSGSVVFMSEDVTEREPHEMARRGLVRSFQITNLFGSLSVYENIKTAVQSNYRHYDGWNVVDADDRVIDRTEEILDEFGLADIRDLSAQEISHGEQRMVDMAIAVAADPDMLLLDEPTSGMSSGELDDLVELFERLSGEIPIVLVEHNIDLVRQISDRVVVLHNGSVIADGSPEEVHEDEYVRDVYLGEAA